MRAHLWDDDDDDDDDDEAIGPADLRLLACGASQTVGKLVLVVLVGMGESSIRQELDRDSVNNEISRDKSLCEEKVFSSKSILRSPVE